jgi:hypothetical protein
MAMVMKIICSSLLCYKSHIHRLKQKKEVESSQYSFNSDRDAISFPACLFIMDMTMGEGGVCEEEGERVSHRAFGSTFVVDLRANHGIACHS